MWMILRALQAVTVPALTARTLWLWLRGRLDGTDVGEILLGAKVAGPVVWVHGASLGEVASAKALISALAGEGPVLVTVTRKPAKVAVREWGLPGVTAAMAPLDLMSITHRLLRAGQVRLLIVLENELWPARLLAAHQAGVPVALVSARMSSATAQVWQKLSRLARAVLAPIAAVVPQDGGSAARFVELGVRPEVVGTVVKLKAGYVPPDVVVPAEFAAWPPEKVVLAAATHAGEEEIVLTAFKLLHERDPAMRLIIAPRHAERGGEVAAMIAAAGFAVVRRSRADAPEEPVYLADTQGEMALWYKVAGVAFVGGSLVAKGGHTPYEPAAAGCPILHGPHVANFAEDYAAFKAAQAAVEVTDAHSLSSAMAQYCGDQALADRAKKVAQPTDVASLCGRLLALRRDQ